MIAERAADLIRFGLEPADSSGYHVAADHRQQQTADYSVSATHDHYHHYETAAWRAWSGNHNLTSGQAESSLPEALDWPADDGAHLVAGEVGDEV
jgi:hypothetical protein